MKLLAIKSSCPEQHQQAEVEVFSAFQEPAMATPLRRRLKIIFNENVYELIQYFVVLKHSLRFWALKEC